MIKRSKYGAKKVTVDGITFDSKLEAKRYEYLKAMEGTQVFNMELQPSYVLVPTFKANGETIRGMKFTPDFKYNNISGETIVEDVKGFITTDYVLRKKMFMWTYCREDKIKFFEITVAGDTKTLY